MKKVIIFFLFSTLLSFSQNKKVVNIGILSDTQTSDTQILLEQLKSEIRGVVGQDATINFNNLFDNSFDLSLAKKNYASLLDNNTDIILSFGVINNLMLHNEKAYPKPTIVFGSVNNDFMNLSEGVRKSGIHNLSYVIAPLSYKNDLEVFKSLYDYKTIGIIIEDYIINELPVKNLFDTYFSDKESTYKFIPLSNNTKSISTFLTDVDAVYFAGGNYLKEEQTILINEINERKLPSFNAFGIKNVEKGVLATNHSELNINQFFRRIALNIESIISGTNASELPLYVSYNKKLTINHSTATQIDFPLRYSLIAIADFIGNPEKVDSEVSLSLVDVMNDVVNNNLALKVEKKNIALSEQDVRLAKSTYLPGLTAAANAVYIDPEMAEISAGQNPEFSTSGTLELQQLIYSKEASTNIEIQKELQNAEKEIYNSSELDALLNASIAYFNVLILKTNAEIQNQNIQITKTNLEFAEQNFQIGATGKSDVLRFRSQLAQNAQRLIEANNQLEQAYNTLNQLLNNKINTKISVNDITFTDDLFKEYKFNEFFELLDNPQLKNLVIDFLVEEAKNNAPELKNIDYNLNAIKYNYNLNDKGRFLPTVSLLGQYNMAFSESGAGSHYPIGAPVVPGNTYNAGVNVTLPLINQNQNNIGKQRAKIQEDQILIQKENSLLSIEKNINDTVLDLINQITNIEISKVSEKNAKESLELTQNDYKNGAVPVIQLIDAQANYLQAQLDQSTAGYNYLIASMQLERAIGTFFLMNSDVENQVFFQKANQFILNKN